VDTFKDTENQLDGEGDKRRGVGMKMIWYRKHRWLGRVLRHDNLLHDIIEEKMLGKAIMVGKRQSYCTI